nr:hypothetical protein [Enterococcus sp. DA9]
MTSQPVAESDYSLDLDVKYERGLVNIFFASENKILVWLIHFNLVAMINQALSIYG